MLRCFALLALGALIGFSQEMTDREINKVAAGYRYLSGAVWSRDGYVLFADVPSNQILRWIPGQKPDAFMEDAQGASGMAYDSQGRLYLCEGRARRVVRIDKKKHMEPLAEKWQGKRFNAPNDIVVRRDGNAYFTDPAFGYQQDQRDLDFYGVFRITSKGELELVSKSQTRPNGVALSPNGRILYVSDSDRRAVRAYDLDKSGAASNERTFIRGIDGVPAGMCVDEKGNLYLTGKSVQVYSPEGKRISHIELPSTSSNCAFGEADLQSLLITAGPSLYRVRLNVKGALEHER
jgi:gluconolactonase